MDESLFWGGRSFEEAWPLARRLVDDVAACGGVITLLWHNNVFASGFRQPWTSMYRKILRRCQEKNAWITSGENDMAMGYEAWLFRLLTTAELWDSTVDQSPYGLLFHKWDFLKIAEKHTGWMLLPYGVYKGKRLLSLFPLFYKRDLLIKSVFSPPPLSCIPYLGADDERRLRRPEAEHPGKRPAGRGRRSDRGHQEAVAELRLRPDAAHVQRHPAVHVERLLGDLPPHLLHRPEPSPWKRSWPASTRTSGGRSRRSASCPCGWSGCTMRGRSATSSGNATGSRA